jgi:hypothetical protein
MKAKREILRKQRSADYFCVLDYNVLRSGAHVNVKVNNSTDCYETQRRRWLHKDVHGVAIK